jgi:biofilm PGA synthesis N-glycosyltransferase PgaC
MIAASLAALLEQVADSRVVDVVEIFVAAFPVVLAMMAIDSSRQFHLDRRGIVTERLEPSADVLARAHREWPVVSVVVPTRDEEHTIADTIAAALALRWPEVEVIVVDDGSVDGTRAVVREAMASLDSAADGAPSRRLRLLAKDRAEGKSSALNDAIASCSAEIVLIVDADTVIADDVVELMAAQLSHHLDLGAVAADVRVLDTARLIQKLQAIEFSATVSTQRRGHAAWGRISTISGACALLRRRAVEEVGGFDRVQPAEDIEITWRLQSAGWRVGYEPSALVGTYMPTTLRGWFRQRRRWARGLVCALRTDGRAATRRPTMWPLLAEATLSVLWCHALVAMTALWTLCVLAGTPVEGNSLLIGRWGALTLGVAVAQILWGMHLDRRDDPRTARLWPYVPLFPLGYWAMSAIVVVWTTVPTLLRPPSGPARWSGVRGVPGARGARWQPRPGPFAARSAPRGGHRVLGRRSAG